MTKFELDKALVELLFPMVVDSPIIPVLKKSKLDLLDFIEQDQVDAMPSQIKAIRSIYKLYEESKKAVPLIAVESSNIKALGWLDDKMYVQFKGDTIYYYENVTTEEYKNVLNGGESKSVGKALQEFKKLNKTYKKLV